MMDFSAVKTITIPEGTVQSIAVGGKLLWNKVNHNLAYLARLGVLDYTAATTHSRYGFTWHIDKKDAHSGLFVIPDELTIGETYTFSYKFQKTGGTLVKVGGHHAAFTQVKWFLDGIEQTVQYSTAVSVSDDTEVHEASFTGVYVGTTGDANLYFQPNRGNSTPVSCQVWDVKLEKGSRATAWEPAPEDVVEVPYIESHGAEYIDTEYRPNQNTGFEVDFIFHNTFDKTGFGSLFGARRNSNDNELLFSSYGGYYPGGLLRHSYYNYDPGVQGETRIFASLLDGVYSNSLGVEFPVKAGDFETPVPLTLFACNHNGDIREFGKVTLCSLKLREGESVVRDYVPRVNSLDEFYLWDRANRKFYGNRGTGAFTGPEGA